VSTRERFEELYRSADDPWAYETSAYEQRKYALTVASLPARRYGRAFEPGCSIGVLTALLAGRCDELLASDVSALAVERARRRLAGTAGVTVERRAIPADWPPGRLDLVVLSEVGYFLAPDELDRTLELAAASLRPGGDLVVVDWLGPIDGYPLDGADVHDRVAREPGLERLVRHEEPQFLLEVFRA
jgi:SAM-dependent methyltransferase